jgi:hypothetical protein
VSDSERHARLEAAAALHDAAAAELERAAAHSRVAATHLRNGEIPRGAAHAWAAHGHVLAAQDRLGEQALMHAARSTPVA